MSNPIVVLAPPAKAKLERGETLSPKQTFLIAGIILVAAVAPAFRIGSTHYAAFGTYWASGYAARTGFSPYVSYPLTYQTRILALGEHRIIADINLNPPCMLPLFSAMSRLPLVTFGMTWTAASMVLLFSTVWLLVRHRPTMQTRQVAWLLLAISVFDTFLGGQIYFLLMFLAAAVWISMDEGHELLATLSLGLLVAIKPTTAFWPVFLLIGGRRKLALRSLAVTAVVSTAPLLLYGWRVYREWFDALKADNHWLLPTDIAIPAYFARFGHRDAGLLIAFALFAYLVWWIWRRKPTIEIASSLALCATLLCAPLAWYDYSLMLAPVFVAHRWNKMETAAAFLMAMPYVLGVFFLSPLGSRMSLSAGGITYFAAAWIILISYLQQSSRKESVRPSGTTS